METTANRKQAPLDAVCTGKALLGFFFPRVSLQAKPAPTSAIACTVLSDSAVNLSCHPRAIVIHVFIRLCWERTQRRVVVVVVVGVWGELRGHGVLSDGRTWKKRSELESEGERVY